MKKGLRLMRLSMRYFKGAKDVTFVPDGEDVTIYGDNGTGKTTIMDAVSWLFFDKDSNNSAKFEIKTLDENGVAIPGIDHEVEGVFENGDTQVTFKKVFREDYTRKRGSLTAELTGHKTDHYVNGAPKSQREYKEAVSRFATREELFQILTSPSFFAEKLTWAKQREMVMEVCRTFTDEEVIAANAALSNLPKILAGRTCDEHKKVLAERRKKINEEIKEIPARIDEQNRAMPELKSSNVPVITSTLIKLREQLGAKLAEIARIDASGGAAELVERLSINDTTLQTIRNAHEDQCRRVLQGRKDKLSCLKDELADAKRDLQTATRDLEMANVDIQHINETIEALKADWYRVDALEFTGTVCPTCGQSYQAGKLEEHRAKFNLEKSTNLEKIDASGLAHRKKLDELTEKTITVAAGIKELTALVSTKNLEVVTLQQEIDNLPSITPAVETLPEYLEAMEVRKGIEKERAALAAGKKSAIKEKLEVEKAELEAKIKDNEGLVSSIEVAQSCQDRIQKLRDREAELGAEFAQTENELFLIEEFIRARVRMMEGSINEKFEIARFKMFHNQINEGLKEVCEVMAAGEESGSPLVPYNSLNTGRKIQVGLDIIKTLSRHYGFYPMIFMDNRESVTSIPEMDVQVINLVVDRGIKTIHMEVTI